MSYCRKSYTLQITVILLFVFIYLHFNPLLNFIGVSNNYFQVIRTVDNNTKPITKSRTNSTIVSIDDEFRNLPSMTLFVRTSFAKKSLLAEVYCEFLRTASLYWSPKLGPIRFVLDAESKKDRHLAKAMLKFKPLNLDISFRFEPLPSDMRILNDWKVSSRGYRRQLYSSFFIDQYVDSDIVAWIDTDCRFTSPVTPNRIISGGKLRVKGMNTFKDQEWVVRTWSKATHRMIGKHMISDFMTYFPMLIWKNTITNCRNYILKHMNASNIAEAMWRTSHDFTEIISPINVIMTYAYYFERDRYDWHIDIDRPNNLTATSNSDNLFAHDMIQNLTSYNAKHVSQDSLLTPQDLTPEIHLSVHGWRYNTTHQFNDFLFNYCAAVYQTHLNFPDNMTSRCRQFKDKLPMTLFEFCNVDLTQGHLNTWCRPEKVGTCHKLIKDHYSDVKRLVQRGIYDLDLRKLKTVEIMASKVGVQCKPLY